MNETFEGFVSPESNFFRLPVDWVDICADIDNLAELKVVQYVIRHTWGFHEYGINKTISTDEFMYGRKRADGSRMDKGTGLSKQSVIDGLKRALQHGFLICTEDRRDLGRIKKSYALNMKSSTKQESQPEDDEACQAPRHLATRPQMSKSLTSVDENVDIYGLDSRHRTEKDTIERYLKKDTIERQDDASATLLSLSSEQAPVENKQIEEKPKRTRTRKTAASSEPSILDALDEETKARVMKVYETFDVLKREAMDNPRVRYARTNEDTQAILTLIENESPTVEGVEDVYRHLWKQSKDEKSGFYWREHMTIKNICKQYPTKIMVARRKKPVPSPTPVLNPTVINGDGAAPTSTPPEKPIVWIASQHDTKRRHSLWRK